MADFSSHAGQIMLALENLVKAQQPSDLSDEEVQVREDWLDANGSPYRGASIVYQGEQYSEGTVGTQDIGYLVGIVLVKQRTADARLPDDKIMEWYEKIRRRLTDQRCLITVADATAPKEHVCIVMPGRTLTNYKNYPNNIIRMLVVAVWMRELPTAELSPA